MAETSARRISTSSIVVAAFLALCGGIFYFLWVNSGGKVPVVTGGDYSVTVSVPRAANLVYFSDVMVAGVKVGKVSAIEEKGTFAEVTIDLDDAVAPLHEGVTTQVKAKSLIDESYLSLTDGGGAEIADGGDVPIAASREAVQLSDVLNAFDPETRDELRALVRDSGVITNETRPALEAAMIGLGEMGRQGATVLDAVASQSDDLQELTRSSARVLSALATQRTQLRGLVANTNLVTQVTSQQSDEVRSFLRALPPLLDTAQDSTDDLQDLSADLTPVAVNLDRAAADVTAALEELPATSRDLRGLIPSLQQVLDRAPSTLTQVPSLSDRLRSLFPNAEAVLADADPMLGYLSRYSGEYGPFFANFAQTLATGDSNGKMFRIMPVINEQSFKGNPLNTNIGPLNRQNSLPGPGTLNNPRGYSGTYERVERDK